MTNKENSIYKSINIKCIIWPLMDRSSNCETEQTDRAVKDCKFREKKTSNAGYLGVVLW